MSSEEIQAEQTQSTDATEPSPALTPETDQEGEVDSESTEAPENDSESDPEPKRQPWFQKRINELTKARHEEKRRADQAEFEAQQLRESRQPDVENDNRVEQEIERRLAERQFNAACNNIYDKGKAEVKEFDRVLSNLQMVGVGQDFLEAVVATDAGHKVLEYLGNDLDEAARIASLRPLQMAREITKIEVKLQSKKPVSKAPPPISPLSTSSSSMPDASNVSAWIAKRNSQLYNAKH